MTAKMTHFDLNAMLNLYDEDGKLQLHKDRDALRTYFRDVINQNTVFFHTLEEKLEYLVAEDYYEGELLDQYDFVFIKSLFQRAYDKQYRFSSFFGAYKFYTGYALKTFDGERWLERFEDRVVMAALYHARGNEDQAIHLVDEMLSNRYQPATPTFLNAGRKQRGEPVSCFLLRIEDNMHSISRAINASLQLSKRGGGVAFCLTSLRETGAPIKKVKGQASGVVPVMKIFEDTFSYANQLGSRSGAGAVYLNVHHPDILQFLDTKRENADEKIRIKTLSLGVVVPDVTFDLARQNKDMYLFSPYDVERVMGRPMSDLSVTEHYQDWVDNPEITKTKTNARKLFEQIAELQFESGYPYLMFEDTVNRANANKGWINMSNLCVAPETPLLTDKGEFPIATLAGQTVNVYNGERFTPTVVCKTGEDQPLSRVTVSTGRSLECTEYHKWYLLMEDNTVVERRTHELTVGDRLIPGTAVDGYDGGVVTVTSIESHVRTADTYCVTESERGMAVFNGILTGNCSEILQTNTPSDYDDDLGYRVVGKDISCNLGSMNVAKAMEGGNLGQTVETAIRALTSVSEQCDISVVPSIAKGNADSRAVGLGQMNLHGFFAKHHMAYGSPESIEFTDLYFMTVAYHAYRTSNQLAIETGNPYVGFEDSTYATGAYFDQYTKLPFEFHHPRVKEIFDGYGVKLPTLEEWTALRDSIRTHGLYNSNLQAVPPTGSISYINHSTSSIHPIAAPIEIRKEGRTGRVYYPAPYLNDENLPFFEDAYTVGYEKIIDVYAAATKHVDQGLSLTLFFSDEATTRDVTKAQIYAWRKGIKTLYYSRIRQVALEGTEVEGCVSCSL